MFLGWTINLFLRDIIRFRNHEKHTYLNQVFYKKLQQRDNTFKSYFSFQKLLQPFVHKTKNLVQGGKREKKTQETYCESV